MTEAEFIEYMNREMQPCDRLLGGRLTRFDAGERVVSVRFAAGREMCHSEVIVQGGFIAGMIDSAMAFAVIGLLGTGTGLATLELKTSFISPGNPGEFEATGRVVHLGKSTAFLSGELHQAGRLVATATSTARVLAQRPG